MLDGCSVGTLMLMDPDVDPLTGGASEELRVLQLELTIGAVVRLLIR